MRKLPLLITLFGFLTLTFFGLLFFYIYLAIPSHQPQLSSKKASVAFAALPTQSDHHFSAEITQSDARVEMVRQVMVKYHSPLDSVADVIVAEADKYKIDFRLIPALALKESGGCRLIPENSFNCWGYGIYTGKVTRFADYAEGVRVVTKALSTRFRVNGEVTPETIMPLYTSSSDGSWATHINTYMSKME